ncbi:MAG: ribbon-helix-helix protein, CopG family [Clostridia bacterium]|nr:ribbon-helix-helix protein, CopG family [Clostridia bacterium]MBR2883257.1 ribbon-helix-helix protein, CopG family [Clostridia bacterium]
MEEKAHRTISVTLPDLLVEEVDNLAAADNRSRSEVIKLAVKQFVSEKRRIELKEQMKRGYLEMGDINLEIAENSLLSDESAYEIYEEFLSESENCDSKTR